MGRGRKVFELFLFLAIASTPSRASALRSTRSTRSLSERYNGDNNYEVSNKFSHWKKNNGELKSGADSSGPGASVAPSMPPTREPSTGGGDRSGARDGGSDSDNQSSASGKGGEGAGFASVVVFGLIVICCFFSKCGKYTCVRARSNCWQRLCCLSTAAGAVETEISAGGYVVASATTVEGDAQILMVDVEACPMSAKTKQIWTAVSRQESSPSSGSAVGRVGVCSEERQGGETGILPTAQQYNMSGRQLCAYSATAGAGMAGHSLLLDDNNDDLMAYRIENSAATAQSSAYLAAHPRAPHRLALAAGCTTAGMQRTPSNSHHASAESHDEEERERAVEEVLALELVVPQQEVDNLETASGGDDGDVDDSHRVAMVTVSARPVGIDHAALDFRALNSRTAVIAASTAATSTS